MIELQIGQTNREILNFQVIMAFMSIKITKLPYFKSSVKNKRDMVKLFKWACQQCEGIHVNLYSFLQTLYVYCETAL